MVVCWEQYDDDHDHGDCGGLGMKSVVIHKHEVS
jgi:hypothetical protein